ncbi:hypothetical protein [Holospora curviuscula]|nr:hypothetical protein [Holospora curviuscula]
MIMPHSVKYIPVQCSDPKIAKWSSVTLFVSKFPNQPRYLALYHNLEYMSEGCSASLNTKELILQYCFTSRASLGPPCERFLRLCSIDQKEVLVSAWQEASQAIKQLTEQDIRKALLMKKYIFNFFNYLATQRGKSMNKVATNYITFDKAEQKEQMKQEFQKMMINLEHQFKFDGVIQTAEQVEEEFRQMRRRQEDTLENQFQGLHL